VKIKRLSFMSVCPHVPAHLSLRGYNGDFHYNLSRNFNVDIKIQSLTLNFGMHIITIRLYRVTPSFQLAATHTVALAIFVSRFNKALS